MLVLPPFQHSHNIIIIISHASFFFLNYILSYDHIGNIVIYDEFSHLNNVTISGNKSETNVTTEIAKTGYTPIAFTVFTVSSNILGGVEYSSGSYYVLLRDLVNATGTTSFVLRVAYLKNA